MSLPNINILFVSNEKESWCMEIQYHCLAYKNGLNLSFNYLNSTNLPSVSKINEFNPNVIIFDLDVDFSGKMKSFVDYKKTKINEKILFIGIIKNIENNVVDFCQMNLIDGVFQKCTKNDESIFVSRMIVDYFNNSLITKGLFSVAKINSVANITIPVTCSSFNFKQISIDSNFKFEFNKSFKIHSNILSKFSWNTDNAELKDTFTTIKNPLMSNTSEFSLSEITQKEYDLIEKEYMEDNASVLEKEDCDVKKEIHISKKIEELKKIKLKNFMNWYKINYPDL